MYIEKMRSILGMSQDEISELTVLEMFRMCEAYWQFQGREGEPHALFTRWTHSGNYFNTSLVTQFPGFRVNLAERMVFALDDKGVSKEDVDIVVSSSFAAIPIGQKVAEMLNAVFVYTEKQGEEQVWTGRFGIPERARVLQVEEVVTTIATTSRVRQAVIGSNPNRFGFVEAKNRIAVATIVHCPPKLSTEYSGYKVVPLMELKVDTWTSREKCPLCAKGSRPLRPKSNWREFAKYI